MMSKNNKLYEEGGLATDGVDVDPVSGNDVPPGSNAEDVRDDIPAQLSSGEYVVPADVVKYFGVAHFEKLRAKAKEGLEDMEEDGRMGGEPVEEVSEGVSDEDLMNLDGYATGGMVMKDSDVNSIIDRVKAAAKSDPSVSNLLKAKGIYMQEDNVGPKVQGQAGPRQFNEGGTTNLNATGTTGDFNPYTYTPGFSVESGTTGVAPTTVGAPVTPAAPTAPVSTAPAPVQCPEGYTLDPATNSCVPITGRSRDRKPPQHDPEAWMKKYDYTDPAVLMEQSLDTLNMGETDEEKGFLDKATGAIAGFFDNGIFGKIFKTQKHAEVLANASVLESHGYTDEASKLREAAGGYAKSNSLKLGGFFDSTTTLTKMAMGTYGMTEMMKGGGNRMASNTPKADERPSTTKSGGRITYAGDKYVDKGLELARKVKNSSPEVKAALVSKRSKGDARPATWKGGKVAANQTNPNKPNANSPGNPAPKKSIAERKGSGPMHSGGRATGGLVDSKTKLKKPGLASKKKK